uniref:Peptidase M12B domain-containing protein n=1 Tax=Rhabditophanes sp. KR3021 TaxID=114890 RepID=A0AC35U444_9BILA
MASFRFPQPPNSHHYNINHLLLNLRLGARLVIQFGTLSLSDGIYIVEPILNDDNQKDQQKHTHPHKGKPKSDDKIHLIYKSKTAHFEDLHVEDRPNNFTITNSTYKQALFSEDTETRKKRSRRSANSWDHYVEVLVVADFKMLQYHQNNLENYILTLFSTVASIYRHPSLRAAINIVVVRIIVIRDERTGPSINNRAQDTLQNFCIWQQRYNEHNEDGLNHHDVAILLTRHDICRAHNKCDTLGLAELGTMCDYKRSCAIIEDNGLSAAFTIAHELGHVFNIPHDDEAKCGYYMALNKENFHIMAPTLQYNTHPWSWSPCSAGSLAKFLDSNRAQTQCIFDPPIQRKYYDKVFENPSPGATYNVDQQCQFVYGPDASICPYMPVCRRLWCAVKINNNLGCRTQHMPWADGTKCGHNSWCHSGECVGMSPQQRSKTDGAWGEWRSFGECSRTCGGGIQKALRDCDNPRPSNGGKYCLGQRERYRSCQIQDCPWDTPGIREVQCSEFDGKNVGIHNVRENVKWLPKYNGLAGHERCKLYCIESGKSAFYLLKDKVIDGTPCDNFGDDVCIDGSCHKAGCDRILDSGLRRDACGICGGDGNTCHVIEGTYNEKGTYGYNEILKIPAGSANIEITQHTYNDNKEDDNYLALRSASGEFLLNGHYQVSVFRIQVHISDVVLEYSGSDQMIERINGTGPLRSDLYLHVLSVGNLNLPDIRYKYNVPSQRYQYQKQQQTRNFYWRHSDSWSTCSSICQGSQTQVQSCLDSATNRPVNEQHCYHSKKLQESVRMCNIDCYLKWQTAPQSRCSVPCGNGHMMQRVWCVKQDTNGNESYISEKECDVSNKPATTITCFNDCSGKKWQYSEWAECSATCGTGGIKYRHATCIDQQKRNIDVKNCKNVPREVTEMECNRIPCPHWVYGEWTECSRSCDSGVQMRHASCQDGAGKELPPQSCLRNELVSRQTCNKNPCRKWEFGRWSACSVSCGTGIETREANCVDNAGNAVSEEECDYRSKIVHKPCEQIACPKFKFTEWSACSVTCLDGWKRRRIYCLNHNNLELPLTACTKPGEQVPPSHQQCNLGSCPFWRSGSWSKCSNSCGSGTKSRKIECIYKEQSVDSSICQDSEKPKNVDACHLAPCTYWLPRQWGACSVTCGKGIQRRSLSCIRGTVATHLFECDVNTKPKESKGCERDPCQDETTRNNIQVQSSLENAPSPRIFWATGSWSECSRPCGNGTQRRVVICRDQVSGRDLGEDYCRHLETIPFSRACNNKPCASWKIDEWGSCSATCGEHAYQERKVTCQADDPRQAALVTDNMCDPTVYPVTRISCNLRPCPAKQILEIGVWETSDPSSCSVTCGGGWKKRNVTCSTATCNESIKPIIFQRCNQQECKKASWQYAPWTHCSVSCGTGIQSRRVWCETDIIKRIKADNSECDENEKPIESRECLLPICPAKSSLESNTISKNVAAPQSREIYNWYPETWSPCSKSCGKGNKTRRVVCKNASYAIVRDNLCDLGSKPAEISNCRVAACPRWKSTEWSPCSQTCGSGVQKRIVFCKKGRREKVPDIECADLAKPQETRKCKTMECPAYKWTVTPWSKCIDLCKNATQTRRVHCVNNDGKDAAIRMCNPKSLPLSSRKCDTSQCPYVWAPASWSTCSKSCGGGLHYRRLECRMKINELVTNGNKTRRPKGPVVLSKLCMALPKPPISKKCAEIDCNAKYHWNVGAWSECTKTCGQGHRTRTVRCVDKHGDIVHKQLCTVAVGKPARRELCILRNCLPSSCEEIKMQAMTSPAPDGDYTILFAGYEMSVYCLRMNESLPKTYINVPSESNFAEIYDKSLLQSYTCPYDGLRNDTCSCLSKPYSKSGFTLFSKLRIDLYNMKININDFTFAKTLYGNNIPYATAGDCYSASDCPQGRFSVDLTHTNLRVTDESKWIDDGQRPSSRIERADNNARILGFCGGFCGKCTPDPFKGLMVEIDHKQNPRIGAM